MSNKVLYLCFSLPMTIAMRSSLPNDIVRDWESIQSPLMKIQAYPCKTKTSQETQKSLKKFLEPNRKPKSFTLTILWNLAKFVKIFLGIIVRRHHTDQTKIGFLKEQCAERKKAPLPLCCNQVCMKIGGQILCNASLICETFMIYYLMGRPQYERRFGEPFNGPIFPFGSLVEYYPVSAKDQSRIHPFGKTVSLGLFLGYALYAGGIWKGDVLIADFEELETMDASEICSERLNAKEVIFPLRHWKINFSNRRWTNQSFWKRSGTENTHLDTGTSNSITICWISQEAIVNSIKISFWDISSTLCGLWNALSVLQFCRAEHNEVAPSWWRSSGLRKHPVAIDENFGWIHFRSRDVHKCNRQFLDSNKEGMLSIALLELFRTARTTLHYPFHESSLSNCRMGCGRYSASNRLEALVDEGDSRSSWRALERWNFLLLSQLHVTILALWS